MNRIALINHWVDETEEYYPQILEKARQANLRDIVSKLKKSSRFHRIILQTNMPQLFRDLTDIEIDDTSRIRSFGARVKRVIAGRKDLQLFYTGSGSSVFLNTNNIRKYLSSVEPNSIIANNLYSTDFFFLRTSNELPHIEDIMIDNSFSRRIIERYNIKGIEIKRDENSLFDLDGPLDLLSLKLSQKGDKILRRFLRDAQLNDDHLVKILEIFINRKKEVLFWGRISEFLITFLRYRTACRTKFVVEGRGLVAQEVNRFYSLFLDTSPDIFTQRFYKRLNRYCDALFIDSRIIFAHYNISPSKSDRFALDMLDEKRIKDKRLLRLCREATRSTIPVIFCNHSFLNAGIPLLIDYIWTREGYRISPYGTGIIKDIIT